MGTHLIFVQTEYPGRPDTFLREEAALVCTEERLGIPFEISIFFVESGGRLRPLSLQAKHPAFFWDLYERHNHFDSYGQRRFGQGCLVLDGRYHVCGERFQLLYPIMQDYGTFAVTGNGVEEYRYPEVVTVPPHEDTDEPPPKRLGLRTQERGSCRTEVLPSPSFSEDAAVFPFPVDDRAEFIVQNRDGFFHVSSGRLGGTTERRKILGPGGPGHVRSVIAVIERVDSVLLILKEYFDASQAVYFFRVPHDPDELPSLEPVTVTFR